MTGMGRTEREKGKEGEGQSAVTSNLKLRNPNQGLTQMTMFNFNYLHTP